MPIKRYNITATRSQEQQAIGTRFRILAATLLPAVSGIPIRILGFLLLLFVARGLPACNQRLNLPGQATISSYTRRMGRTSIQRQKQNLRWTYRITFRNQGAKQVMNLMTWQL